MSTWTELENKFNVKEDGISIISNNNLGRIHLGYSAAVTADIVQLSLPTFYDQEMQRIRELINKTQIEQDSGKAFKKYIWVLMVDNYANTNYAAEQTGKKEFTSTTVYRKNPPK